MSVVSRGIRNTFRNVIRTFSIVVILSLSMGLALIMLVARQAVQTRIDSVKSSIGNTITVSPAGERGFAGGGEPLTSDQIAKIKSTTHVTAVTQTLQDRLDSSSTNLQSAIDAGSLGRRFNGGGGGGAGGGTSRGNFTPPVIISGTNDVNSLQSLGGGTAKITAGQAFDPNVDANVAIVGSGLATKNNLNVGSTFQAYGATIKVAAIFDAGNRFSNSALVMPLPTVQRLSQQPGDISTAMVQVDSITNLDSTTAAIKSQLGDAADVVSQQDTSNQALAPLQNIKSISTLSLFGALAAGAVIILLTMLMIVRERRREIGVLKAIGASNFKVMGQFIVEAVTFTIIAAVVGLGIAAAGANPVTQVLVSTSSSSNAAGGGAGGPGGGGGAAFRFAGRGGAALRSIHAAVGWNVLLYGLLVAVAIAVVGSAIPAYLIAKVRPAEVMRSE